MGSKRVEIKGPRTPDDWLVLRFEAEQLFSPSAPIDEDELFAGRLQQRSDIIGAVLERGRHVMVFGERGVGKTSLVNTFYRRLNKANLHVWAIREQADPSDTFTSLWKKAFRDITYLAERDGSSESIRVDSLYQGEIYPDDVRRELSGFSSNEMPIVILDEFDKLKDRTACNLVANTIKALSDYSVNVTVILVGVADNVTELLGEHDSIRRCITQVRMPRMSQDELEEILDKRLLRLRMKITGDARWKIIMLSRGFPTYIHALGKYATLGAIAAQRLEISEADVDKAITAYLDRTDESFTEQFRRATHSNQPKNLYTKVLLACSLAETDDAGFFTPAAIREPLSKILGEVVDIDRFQRHLADLILPKRSSVLQRKGGERNYRFRFADPMMQPFIIMKGVDMGVFGASAKSALSFPEQPFLPLGL